MNFIQLETDRLLLKGVSSEHMKYIFNNHSKSEIMEILALRTEESYAKEEFKHKNGYSSYNRLFILFMLIHKESGNMIGRCGLHNWNPEHKRAEIGYVMEDESFKRQGLMSETVKAVIDYGFSELALNRIEALIGIDNVASLKIAEKFNFTQEGVLRKHYYIGGKFVDSVVFSKLATEHNR